MTSSDDVPPMSFHRSSQRHRANWTMQRVHGQESFRLTSDLSDASVTRLGGMLGPVTFFPKSNNPIRPYAIAPWAEERLSPDTPSMVVALRGDWFCSAFGENREPHGGRQLPPHGETANGVWDRVEVGESEAGCWLQLGISLPLQGGRCVATTALLHGQSMVYQRHDLSDLRGPINPGHHATLAFPGAQASGRLSFSKFIHGRTYFEPTERPENRGYSWLEPDSEFIDLQSVRCLDGSTTAIDRYPARRGFEDIAILCAAPHIEVAWSAVAFPEQGYAWFALRNPKQLTATLLWFSNGGRHFPPWNGRHINVMGIEDITGFFHVGLAASCRPNLLTQRGIRTCLEPDALGCLSIPYIQGVVRIPEGFDRVVTIERQPSGCGILLTADSGAQVSLPCHVDFLRSGTLPGLEFS